MPAAPPRKAWSATTASLTAVLAGVATTLQGCDFNGHPMAAWESQPSYLFNFQFVQNAQTKGYVGNPQAVLNSCNVPGVPAAQRCSGRGTCTAWDPADPEPVYFCQCERGYADPECRTLRKSQATAFFISLFGGIFGLDRLYLGDYLAFLVKLCTGGGLGLWWVYDIARTGSGPVYTTSDFRLATDLAHYIYVFVAVGFFALLGFWFFAVWGPIFERKRRIAKLLVEAEAEFVESSRHATDIRQEDRQNSLKGPIRRSMNVPLPGNVFGYGALVDAPPQVKFVSFGNPLSSYSSWAAARNNPVVASDMNAKPPSWFPQVPRG